MKKKGNLQKELKAMTLPELLIVLVVGGLLFIALFEGWNTVRRCSIDLLKRGERGYTTFSGIEKLDALFFVSDSIVPTDRTIVFFRRDSVAGVLDYSRSSVIFEWHRGGEAVKDILLRNVQAVVPVVSGYGKFRKDSLYVTLKEGNKSWCLGFGRRPLEEEERVRKFELLEKEKEPVGKMRFQVD